MNQRPIKFRQYLGEGKWHYWGFTELGGFTSPVQVDLIPSQQFTGEEDKRKVEMYEGDIVEEGNYKGVIRYFINPDPFGAFTTCFNVELNKEESVGLHSKFKVIGNITENPELLKTK